MSVSISQRPFIANPATSGTYLVIDSDRAIFTPWAPTEYDISFTTPISLGSEIIIGDVTLELIISAPAYDPLNPNHIDATTTDTNELNRRIANAINSHAALNNTVYSYISQVPTLKLFSVNGQVLAFTPTGTGSVTLTQVDAGSVATTRPNYRIVTECYVPIITATSVGSQEVFTPGTSLAIPSKITAAETTAPTEAFPFELQRILRGFLQYEGYAPQTDPKYLSDYAKAFFVRYREEWTGYEGKWLYDPVAPLTNPNDPYDADLLPLENAVFPQGANVFMAVNAQIQAFDTLPETDFGYSSGLCLDRGTTYPNSLIDFFETIQRLFLSSYGGKLTYKDADEFLAFFVGVQDGVSLATLTLRQEIRNSGGNVTTLDTTLPIPTNTSCFSDITNNYVGRTIQLQNSQLWANVPDDAVQVCYQILGVLPEDGANLYTLGDNGTFETAPVEHEAFDFTFSACPVNEVSVARSNVVAFAGSWSMAVLFGCDWTDETFKIRGTADTTLSPNTTYELTAWVFVPAEIVRAFDQGASLWLSTSGFVGSTLTIVDSYNYETDPRGQWRQLRSILDVAGDPTGRIEFHNDSLVVRADFDTGLYIDNIRVQQDSLSALTKKYTFEIADPCEDYATFAFQNALGVVETMHLPGRVLKGFGFESEQAKAKQRYTKPAPERRELFNLSTQETAQYTLNTRLESYNLFKINELLRSGHVEWITDAHPETKGCEDDTTGTRVIPVVFNTEEVDSSKIEGGSLEFTLEFVLSREVKRIQK